MTEKRKKWLCKGNVKQHQLVIMDTVFFCLPFLCSVSFTEHFHSLKNQINCNFHFHALVTHAISHSNFVSFAIFSSIFSFFSRISDISSTFSFHIITFFVSFSSTFPPWSNNERLLKLVRVCSRYVMRSLKHSRHKIKKKINRNENQTSHRIQ